MYIIYEVMINFYGKWLGSLQVMTACNIKSSIDMLKIQDFPDLSVSFELPLDRNSKNE